jgi:hypothetical protein
MTIPILTLTPERRDEAIRLLASAFVTNPLHVAVFSKPTGPATWTSTKNSDLRLPEQPQSMGSLTTSCGEVPEGFSMDKASGLGFRATSFFVTQAGAYVGRSRWTLPPGR